MGKKQIKQEGFTIVELLIATVVFGVVLLLCTFAIMAVGKTYTKGVNSTITQNTARAIIDDISQSIQFSGGTATSPSDDGGNKYHFCTGTKRYTYLKGKQLTDSGSPAADESNHVFTWDNKIDDCGNPIDWTLNDHTEMLGPRMSIAKFGICAPGDGVSSTCFSPTLPSSNLYSITIRVTYGASDLLEDKLADDGTPGTDGINDTCKTDSGSQYCAVSELTTIVQKRYN